ncbi:hypothetical protein Nepgr_005109 [Nepenthes gracilis]|uniref:Uncharacterized protein n=1 Tax=Nepenthes gracilis TaxID=150966 RepID=A0AAD3XG11_NEPGR|nr:hypothetical protein Nepgr_005109 [Nepenthes gracilis]
MLLPLSPSRERLRKSNGLGDKRKKGTRVETGMGKPHNILHSRTSFALNCPVRHSCFLPLSFKLLRLQNSGWSRCRQHEISSLPAAGCSHLLHAHLHFRRRQDCGSDSDAGARLHSQSRELSVGCGAAAAAASDLAVLSALFSFQLV